MSNEGPWILHGAVVHERHLPIQHAFRYPVTFYRFDVDHMRHCAGIRGFGYNRRGRLQLHDRDYLTGENQSISRKLDVWLDEVSPDTNWTQKHLITSARWFGYVFNPVSFYICSGRKEDTTVKVLVAEVNNTFKDRHVYAQALEMEKAEQSKEFHVSPFNNMAGRYQFSLHETGNELSIGVDLYRDGEKIITTWIEGQASALTSGTLRRESWRHPLRPWLTMPRILVQAAILKFKHRLPHFVRPKPSHRNTIRDRGEALPRPPLSP